MVPRVKTGNLTSIPDSTVEGQSIPGCHTLTVATHRTCRQVSIYFFFNFTSEVSFKISSPLKGACSYSPCIFNQRKSSNGAASAQQAEASHRHSWSASHRSKLGNTCAALLELTMKTPFPAHWGLLILIRWLHQVRNHNHLLKPLSADPKAP